MTDIMDREQTTNSHLARERAVYDYLKSLDNGDLDGIIQALQQALDDAQLDEMLIEAHQAYFQEENSPPEALTSSATSTDVPTPQPMPSRPHASRQKRRSSLPWIGTLAAVLVVGVLFGSFVALIAWRQAGTAIPAPVISTSCPAPGTGRTAVMPPLQSGTHQNIVFFVDPSKGANGENPLMSLNRYDVSTRTTSVITTDRIQTAQISHDGQWLLLSVMEGSVSEIQLIRLDGQYRQTLYCAPKGQVIDPTNSTGMQWSPDQAHIIFTQGGAFGSPTEAQGWSVLLLDLTSGKIQAALSSVENKQELLPVTWRNTTQVLLLEQVPFEQAGDNLTEMRLYLLDISKGPNQHLNDLPLLSKSPRDPNVTWGFALSADGGTLFQSTMTSLQTPPYVRSIITARSLSSGKEKQILVGDSLDTGEMRAINASSLMFASSVQNGPTQDILNKVGIWKINNNGSGLTHLSKQVHNDGAGPGTWGAFCPFSRNPWSNFSRDGLLYSDGTSYGSLHGGPLTSYTDQYSATLVGWTTM